MKRILALLMMLALAVPALAEEPADLSAYVLARDPFEVDLDGDGANERVSWAMVPGEYDEHLALTVETARGEALVYDTDILYGEAVYMADLDGDGAQEILLSGDVMSDDYCTYCVRYLDGTLVEVLFADVNRGDNTGGYFKYGYGQVAAIDGGKVTLAGTQDVLGTWMAARDFVLTPAWRFETADGGEWVREVDPSDAGLWDYAALTLKAAQAYADADGDPAGTLKPGDRLLITASDKQTYARFVTADGVEGRLAISPDYEKGWGWQVNGLSEDDLFEFVPYAD